MIAQRIESNSGNAFVAIGARARSTRAPVLVAFEVAGFAAALAIYALIPERTSLAFPFAAAGAFGLWGTVDRLLQSPPRIRSWRRSLLRQFQLVVALVGIGCALATGFAAAGWLMGVFVL